ncbi:MAG: 30S ribosomal protein S8 [Pseudomonadota bacterium]|nr:30S ribosomal protein S8 [Pseudomonadota bacterium]
MSMTDPIADMLTQLRNGLLRHRDSIAVPYSRLKEAVAGVLVAEGYLLGCEAVDAENGHRQLLLRPKYYQGKAVISKVERASKPSRRFYCGKEDVPQVDGGLGIAVLTTPQGVMTDRAARAAGIGGEVVCYVS